MVPNHIMIYGLCYVCLTCTGTCVECGTGDLLQFHLFCDIPCSFVVFNQI